MKQAALLSKSVKVIMYICARDHAHSHSTWAENTANVWLPYTNMWETPKCHNFNSEAWINNPRHQMPTIHPFCVPI